MVRKAATGASVNKLTEYLAVDWRRQDGLKDKYISQLGVQYCPGFSFVMIALHLILFPPLIVYGLYLLPLTYKPGLTTYTKYNMK
jgi:hypothetical protein